MDRAAISRVEEPNLRLCLIEPDDAAYVHGLRTDPRYNNHLSAVTGAVDDQQQWIEGYKSCEAVRHDLPADQDGAIAVGLMAMLAA
jgi:hypothetical protein